MPFDIAQMCSTVNEVGDNIHRTKVTEGAGIVDLLIRRSLASCTRGAIVTCVIPLCLVMRPRDDKRLEEVHGSTTRRALLDLKSEALLTETL